MLVQTFTDFDSIVSDDGSTDDTEANRREYAAKGARITYVRQSKNRGAPINFQFVMNEAIGVYLCGLHVMMNGWRNSSRNV